MKFTTCFYCLFVIFIAACNGNKKTPAESSLLGKWYTIESTDYYILIDEAHYVEHYKIGGKENVQNFNIKWIDKSNFQITFVSKQGIIDFGLKQGQKIPVKIAKLTADSLSLTYVINKENQDQSTKKYWRAF